VVVRSVGQVVTSEELNKASTRSEYQRVIEFLLRHSYGLGVNLPYLFRWYLSEVLNISYEEVLRDRKLYHRYYRRLYRLAYSLAKEGYVSIYKADGLIWIKPKAGLVDLISTFDTAEFKPVSNSQASKSTASNSRIHWARLRALRFLKSSWLLDEEAWAKLYGFFEEYLEDTGQRVLVLKREGGEEFLLIPYKHRFLRSEVKRKLKEFRRLWEAAANERVGVFITLTMDPSSYKNLFEASRLVSKAFNRFMSFLSRRLGFRPRYICVFELQDSGNPHLHVVIFGISRIEDHYKLTEILRGQGFGIVHYEYKIVNQGGSWTWASGVRPPRCRTNDVKGYLSKYLSKALGGDLGNRIGDQVSKYKVAFYFASGKRFFTCSRSLLVRRSRGVSLSTWVFVGSFHYLDLPDFVLEYLESIGLSLRYDLGKGWVIEPIA
jgi:hypothetical protein